MYGTHRQLRLATALAAMCLPTLAARAATVQVTVSNFSFGSNNAPVTINVGDTVEWTLSGGTHTVTSGTPSAPDGKFDAPVDSAHMSFSFTFSQAGTYDYYCKFHAACCGMTSSIIVKAAATTVPERSLGGASNNAIAVGRDSTGKAIAAVAAGTRLYLLNPLDTNLADIANWSGGKDLGAAVSGRPAFGLMAGALIVAVGTDDGRGHIFNVATGADAGNFDVSNGSIPNAPAITDHAGNADIYWAAQSSNGPVLVRTRGTDVSGPVSLGTAGTVLSSPAVFEGVLIVGTSANVQTYRVDPATGALTPQATAGGGATFNTSPVVGGNGEALIGAANGSVHKINLATGAEDGTALALPNGAGPLSDPFYDGPSGLAAFGGSDGNVYFVSGNAMGANATLASTENFGTAAVRSPVTVSGRTYVADASGKFGLLGGVNPADLGGATGKAVAATGSIPRTDVVLVNTTDGTLAAIPLLFGGRIATKTVAQGLASPIALVPVPDGTGRLFIVDQTGQIRILNADGTLVATPFLNIASRMVSLNAGYDERGLLGLAFHPQYATNGRFFVYYSRPLRAGAPAGFDDTATLSEFHVSSDPNVADAASERVILQIDKPQSNHNGGTIDFGPDGYLYWSIGDGGGANDDGNGHVADWYLPNAGGNGQDVTHNLLGNILRLDVNGAQPYAIPADNPFKNGPGLPEIYAYGFRNPYRFSFDMGGTHEMYGGDAGQNLWEEIDHIVKGGNYGWNVKEGTHPFSTADPNHTPAGPAPTTGEFGEPLIDPIIEYANAGNPNGRGLGEVNVGGNIYRGTLLPNLAGDYLFGDWSRSGSAPDGSLFVAVPRASGLWNLQEFQVAGSTDGRLHHFVKGFGQDTSGEVYVLVSDAVGPSGTTGLVLQLVAP